MDSKTATTEHPFPWRATCAYCREVITYDPPRHERDFKRSIFWHFCDPWGRHHDCKKAPKRDSDRPGFHRPITVLSCTSKDIGPVPPELHPTFEEYE